MVSEISPFGPLSFQLLFFVVFLKLFLSFTLRLSHKTLKGRSGRGVVVKLLTL